MESNCKNLNALFWCTDESFWFGRGLSENLKEKVFFRRWLKVNFMSTIARI